MRLLVLADTHLPTRARDLPPEVWAAAARADVVAHATLEGVRVTVVHETGAAKGRERWADRTFPDTGSVQAVTLHRLP